MRISDWSSDVCSSDLHRQCGRRGRGELGAFHGADPPGFFVSVGEGVELPVRLDLPPAMGEAVGLEDQEQDDGATDRHFLKVRQRSEVHTMELQSLIPLSYVVPRLKQNTMTRIPIYINLP